LRSHPALPYIVAGRVAVGQFWTLLQDFAVLHQFPHTWPGGKALSEVHAFLALDTDVGVVDGVHAIKVVPRLMAQVVNVCF